jgi:hypothetical protein
MCGLTKVEEAAYEDETGASFSSEGWDMPWFIPIIAVSYLRKTF